jgi:hypothetical protein
MDEADRKALAPWQVSLYLPTSATGIALTGSTENKVAVTVIPPPELPNGFDQYVTPQGPAIRFIGSGLGNGDSGAFQVTMHMSIEATTGSATTDFKCMTRPYTETLFTNATVIPGCVVSRKMANNDEGALAIVAPLVQMSDGDLLELSINPDSGITVTIHNLSVTVMEVN